MLRPNRATAALHFLPLAVLAFSIALAGCGSGPSSHFMPNPTPPGGGAAGSSTTLQAEIGNNTSAPNGFATQGNGNAAPGNVSKLPIRSLLYSGSTTKVYASFLAWFGGSNHMNVGYRSDDPAQIHRQVQDMMSRGIQGAIVDWFGPNTDIINPATLQMRKEAEANPGFEFAVMEDSGALFDAAVANGCDVTNQLISDLNYINAQFTPSPAYMRLNGKKPIFMFGVTQFYIDWQRVLASLPQDNLLLFRGTEGLQQSFAGGAFQWLDINSNDAFDPQLSAQDAFYQTAKQTPSRAVVGSGYKGFDDPLALWGTNRQVHQRCGQTWLETFHDTGKFYSANNQLPAMQIVTWNDYEEGSEVETGIDNCAFLTPSISGTTLNWTLAGGPESTVDHYTVFSTTDGQNLTKLADVPVSQHSIDLSKFSLPSSVSLYVKATGQPSIRNVMSSPIVFKAGDAPPHPVLNVSQDGDLSVSASTAGSSDPDGSISQTTIDFGDGTVVQSVAATHKYAAVGPYFVTATVVDNGGASAIAVSRVEAKSAAPGVTILAPANSATVNWPTPIMASVNSANAIRRVNVLIDGNPAYATDFASINSALKVFTGNHHITVQAIDANGATSQAGVDVVAEPGDAPPTAAVTVTPLHNISSTTVLACSVGSHDPDGFILTYKSTFSDGATFFTPAAVHALPAPGQFSVTVNVMDQFGAQAQATQNFSVSTASSGAAATAPIQIFGTGQKPVRPRYEPIRRP